MPLPPPPRLSSPESSGSFVPPAPVAGDPSAGAAPVPGESNPSAMSDLQTVLAIVTAGRTLANKYPSVVPEVQMINDAVQKLQMKIMMVQPPTEVAAPPQ